MGIAEHTLGGMSNVEARPDVYICPAPKISTRRCTKTPHQAVLHYQYKSDTLSAMSSSKVSLAPRPSLRDEQSKVTRERILEAVRVIFEREPDTAFSFDDLSREAGVSRRTIFRYFKDKDELLDAFLSRTNELFGVPVWPSCEADLVSLPPDLFEALKKNSGTVHALNVSAAGREVRLRDNKARQAAFRKSLKDASKDLSPQHKAYLEAVVHLLFTTSAWQIMKDHWNLEGREAGNASAWAIGLLLDAARAKRPKLKLLKDADSR
jgi:AcrR family transcriptional regulator